MIGRVIRFYKSMILLDDGISFFIRHRSLTRFYLFRNTHKAWRKVNDHGQCAMDYGKRHTLPSSALIGCAQVKKKRELPLNSRQIR